MMFSMIHEKLQLFITRHLHPSSLHLMTQPRHLPSSPSPHHSLTIHPSLCAFLPSSSALPPSFPPPQALPSHLSSSSVPPRMLPMASPPTQHPSKKHPQPSGHSVQS